MNHTCHAYGCLEAVPPKLLMCARHWKGLTPELRRDIWKHYRPGQESDKQPSPDYMAAAKAAIDYLKHKSCAWHKDDQPVHPAIGCEYCGTMLSTKDCRNCRKHFLDWGDASFDDVIAGPYVTESGDLACFRCGPDMDRRAEEARDEEAIYDGFYDEIY